MVKYGFKENIDFIMVAQKRATNNLNNQNGVDFMKELIILILLGIGASTAWLTLSLLTGAVVIKAVIYIINKIEGEKK